MDIKRPYSLQWISSIECSLRTSLAVYLITLIQADLDERMSRFARNGQLFFFNGLETEKIVRWHGHQVISILTKRKRFEKYRNLIKIEDYHERRRTGWWNDLFLSDDRCTVLCPCRTHQLPSVSTSSPIDRWWSLKHCCDWQDSLNTPTDPGQENELIKERHFC